MTVPSLLLHPARARAGARVRRPSASRAAALIILCAVAVAVAAARAAEPGPTSGWPLADYAHEAWRITEGLPQDSVTAILQSRDGYLWLGTLDGVARFDGLRFETFNLIREAGIESNAVTALAEDRDGTLWIGTSGGIVRLSHGRFALWDVPQLADRAVRAFLAGRDGSLWIGTRWGGLYHVRAGRATAITTAQGLTSNDVRALAEGPDGTLWIGTSGGLHRLKDGRVSAVNLDAGRIGALIVSVHVDRRAAVWVGTPTELWALEPGQGTPARRITDRWGVQAFSEDADGTLWIGTSSGVGRVRGGEVEKTLPGTLTFGVVRSLALDREGSLWIGTDGGGLNRFRKASVVMRVPGEAPWSPLMTILRASDGTVWAGGHCGGVNRWDGDRATTYRMTDGLPSDCVRSLAEDAAGAIWVGTNAGLARIAKGRVSTFSAKDGLSSDRVMTVSAARDGSLWVGTGDAGVDRLVNGRVANLRTRSGLVHDDVRVVVDARDGVVWIGTLGGGISLWKNGTLSRLTRKEGLSSNNVLALHEDADGTMWIGTNGGGLNRYRRGRIARYTMSTGLFSDGIFQILDDGAGHLWFGCNRGIFRVSRQDLEAVADGRQRTVVSTAFGRPDGLRPAGVMGGSQPAGAIDRKGRLWFPTIEGAAIIDPQNLVRNAVPPQVQIERLRVNQREVPRSAWLSIPPGDRRVEIDYTALSLVAPSRVAFKFRLSGTGDEWVDVGGRRTAYFTGLRPGRYEFSVKAANNDGVWNDRGATIAFELQPFFHERPIFYAVWALPILGLLWLGVRLRVRALQARQRELTAQVDRAMAEIKVLSGLLPICASCKRIRDDQSAWVSVEDYLHEHTEAEFSHGICPDCMKRLYPEYHD